ncbi:D-Ala-D-Ala carboxypeptidase VanY [Clostridium folliculivorans]|uniref:D-Ala-D-Ala carboxypeptidase VanY n=1 Tax=Clostridium folliculivorans TaxID=2886038 RepID=A0A9W5Y2L0_9CLOT|nr:M15 family metallopeptidase [Clostridium folliculivorans]GKU25402.1 D-Ala-D-Ala carboxypeptidase VanY [Clostridium folliculivorans]
MNENNTIKKKSSIMKKVIFLYTFIFTMSVVLSASIISINKSKKNTQVMTNKENITSQNSTKNISINNGSDISSIKQNGVSNDHGNVQLTSELVNKISSEDSRLLLVNKDYPLDDTYKPDNLVIPKVKMLGSVANENKKLKREAAEALEDLFSDAKKEKINLIFVSGYRSFESQASVYERKLKSDGATEASKYVAKQGSSEHQTGLAVDINSSPYYDLAEDFEKTKEGKWIAENAYKYGFVIRYLKGKSDITGYNYEPWHLRYVGKENAKYMYENNLCLEEYMRKLAAEKNN